MTPRRKTATTAGVVGTTVIGLFAGVPSAVDLSGDGPVRVRGTTATAAFPYGGATLREVRYVDKGRLTYDFTLANDGLLPVTVTGLARQPDGRGGLLTPQALRHDGERVGRDAGSFTVWPGSSTRVRLRVSMSGCERVSSRAGSLLEHVQVRADVAGLAERGVDAKLPERLHTGSPRDAHCPGSTSTTRSPG